jgi:hypothetical protein
MRVLTGTPMAKALACGMLEDGGRVLFLVRKDANGIERIEMPCVLVFSGRSPHAEIKDAFPKMTGIDAEVHEIIIEGRHNSGSRKRRSLVPVLVFKITARNRTAKPSGEFSGFKWLSLDDAKGQRLCRNAEWLRKEMRRVGLEDND